MAVFLNGRTFRKARWNGTALRRIFCNGVLVWRSIPEYLYRPGDEAAETTGGWRPGATWAGSFAEKRADGIWLRGKGSGPGASGADNTAGAGYVYTERAVDLTDVDRLTMTYTGHLEQGRVLLGVTDEPAHWVGSSVEPAFLAVCEESGVKDVGGTLTLDVHAVTGRHPVLAAAKAGGYAENWYAQVVITEIGCE